MLPLPVAELDRLLDEDAAHGDLTTAGLGIGDVAARMHFHARAAACLAGIEDAAALLQRVGAEVQLQAVSGAAVLPGTPLLQARGRAEILFAVWKVAQTLVEWASGVATATAGIVAAARAERAQIAVACTRKNVPGTRRLAARAVRAGGGSLHRLGLSETVLLFPEHQGFLPQAGGASAALAAAIAGLRVAAPERSIVVEVATPAQAWAAARAGADVVQLEKFTPELVAQVAAQWDPAQPRALLAAAGGINAANAAAYARAGAALLVTSAPYYAPPCDVQVVLVPD